MDLLDIVDELEEAILEGHRGRFGRGWVVDRDKMLDLVDRLRTRAPVSVEQAQQVLEERGELIRQAREEARIISQRANEEAELRVGSHDIVMSAQARAAEIIERANQQATDSAERARDEAAGIRGRAAAEAVQQALEADRYSLEILNRLIEHLRTIDTTIGNAVTALETKIENTERQQALDSRDAQGAAEARDAAPIDAPETEDGGEAPAGREAPGGG